MNRYDLLAVGLAFFLLGGCGPAEVSDADQGSSALSGTRALAADDFVGSMGTNVHLSYPGVYVSGFSSIIEPRLEELGFRHVRDNLTPGNTANLTHLQTLAKDGVHAMLVWDPRSSGTPEQGVAFVKAVGVNLVDLVEGPNEFNLSGRADWASELQDTAAWVSAVKADPATRSLKVLAPSITTAAASASVGSFASEVDFGNMHNYWGGHAPESAGWGGKQGTPYDYGSLDFHEYLAREVAGNKPIISSETGYHDALQYTGGHLPTPDAVQAKYMPRLYLNQFAQGIVRTYNYELIDQGVSSTNDEKSFGLLRNDGTPKPSFLALRNLIALLEDPGPAFTPASFAYTLEDAPADLKQVLLQKRDGTFYLALWRSTPTYDPNTRKVTAVPPAKVTLSLGTATASAKVYLPTSHGTGVVSSASAPRSLTLEVPDEVMLVELVPSTHGLRGAYFANQGLSGTPALTRVDATVDFNWNGGAPSSAMPTNHFSVEWTGSLHVPRTGAYTLFTRADDGVELFVDGKEIISDWDDHATKERSASLTLSEGGHPVTLRYYEDAGGANCALSWEGPGIVKAIIPAAQLSP